MAHLEGVPAILFLQPHVAGEGCRFCALREARLLAQATDRQQFIFAEYRSVVLVVPARQPHHALLTNILGCDFSATTLSSWWPMGGVPSRSVVLTLSASNMIRSAAASHLRYLAVLSGPVLGASDEILSLGAYLFRRVLWVKRQQPRRNSHSVDEKHDLSWRATVAARCSRTAVVTLAALGMHEASPSS